jgi:hypothetical protein
MVDYKRSSNCNIITSRIDQEESNAIGMTRLTEESNAIGMTRLTEESKLIRTMVLSKSTQKLDSTT